MSQQPAPDRWPAVTVIVVGYNSRQHLAICLAALARQRYDGPIEVCFVDNASADGSCAEVAARFPAVRVIASGTNRGYAGGNNRGACAASGEILVFLNPDTEAQPDAIRELVRPLVEDPTVGLTTAALVLFDRRDVLNTAGNSLHLSGLTVCRLAGQPLGRALDEDVPAASGACCAIRQGLFAALGGFDEAFFMYLEDTDLSWRVRLAGYRCRLAARAVVAHHYRLKLGAEKTFWLERNRYRMLVKNLAPLSTLVMMPLLLATEAVTLGWALLSGRQHLRAKLRAYLWLAGNLGSCLRARHVVQARRRSADYPLLAQHERQIPIAVASDGALGRLASRATAPVFQALALPVLAFTLLQRRLVAR